MHLEEGKRRTRGPGAGLAQRLGPVAEGCVWLSQSLPWAESFLLCQIRPGPQAASIFL